MKFSSSRTRETFCYVDGESSVPTDLSGRVDNRVRSLDITGRRSNGGIIEQRESVFQMALNGLNSIVHGDAFRRRIVRCEDRRQRNQTPTYVSVRKRDKNFVCSSSFPSSRYIPNSALDPTFFGVGSTTETPFVAQSIAPTEQPRFYTPVHDIEDTHDDQELDDKAAYDLLFFDESRERLSPTPNDFSKRSLGRQIAIDTPKSTTKLQTVLKFLGFEDEKAGSRLRSLVKFKFSMKRSPQKVRGMPIYGRFRHDAELVRRLKDESCDYRPYFTYWISTVHIIVTLFMLMFHGIGTDYSNGLNVIERSGDVMSSSLSSVHIVVWEQNNVWIGPRFADLVHTGAKFTPCMRRDNKIYEQIAEERRVEAESTGCCMGLGGCFQTSECSKQFATLLKWINGTFPETNYSRVVCGQDPRYCIRPRSVHPYVWGLNISNWPPCEEHSSSIPKFEKHMHCTVTGHPCCIQMHGQCRITSREYCDFVRGYYHPNATLCSQVSCLNELYRFITPLFIHAGLIRCVISLTIYLTIMSRFEIMIGWLRLSAIYFVSGIGGYLASAVFVPYMPEVGPAGSEGGVLGALIVNILYNWSDLDCPLRVLLFHLLIAVILFLTGFLPYIDNWAQLFGFIFGSLMALVVIPYITFGTDFGKRDEPAVPAKRDTRLVIVVGSSTIMALLFFFLAILFFFSPLNYEVLGLLNCPFPGKICDHQGLILRNWLPI
uniref:Peptidase S54 rhomboid domain-containing protein n=1 Tax=Globodera rostochiensis TaxID=31243 RepID=A0A914HKC1_GLORO